MKPTVILAGGTGFVGRSLIPSLSAAGYDVAILSRGPSHNERGVRFFQWDGKTLGNWASALEGAAAVVNLAGRNINCRHTPANRRAILDSRIDSVRALGAAIDQANSKPRVFVQAAGIGIYGNAGDRWCDESAAAGDDVLADVCKKWEAAFHEVNCAGTRKVLLRLGVALGHDGGFLQVISKLTRLFLGGRIGSGRQFISWIHMNDLTRMFLWGIEKEEIAGVFNACSPNPVTNDEFMRELRQTLRRPWSPPVPKFAARLGSWLMGTEASLAFASQRGTPRNFLEHGFPFHFPELRPALRNLL